MEPLEIFSFHPPKDPLREKRLESELLLDGKGTGRSIPGLVLEAQYRCAKFYLFVTSWDCGDDSLDVILTDGDFQVLDRKSVGAMYDCTWLESHEVLSENQVLLHCDNHFLIRVTIGKGLVLHQKYGDLTEFIPYPSDPAVEIHEGKPWWKPW